VLGLIKPALALALPQRVDEGIRQFGQRPILRGRSEIAADQATGQRAADAADHRSPARHEPIRPPRLARRRRPSPPSPAAAGSVPRTAARPKAPLVVESPGPTSSSSANGSGLLSCRSVAASAGFIGSPLGCLAGAGASLGAAAGCATPLSSASRCENTSSLMGAAGSAIRPPSQIHRKTSRPLRDIGQPRPLACRTLPKILACHLRQF
jgi:hypothetical protein